jgi:hypothetical protein
MALRLRDFGELALDQLAFHLIGSESGVFDDLLAFLETTHAVERGMQIVARYYGEDEALRGVARLLRTLLRSDVELARQVIELDLKVVRYAPEGIVSQVDYVLRDAGAELDALANA